MEVIYEARLLLLVATAHTLLIFVGSLAIALPCAFVAGIAVLSRTRAVHAVAACYIELFRGTSLVVQLFWLYFALPSFGVTLSSFQAATVGLGLCFGAYGAEVVRGAISAVPRTQHEAAIALNMSRSHTLFRVVMPQAFLIMLPPLSSLLVLLLKSTATASLITVPELTFEAYSLNVRTLQTTAIFTVVLVVYFILSLVVSRGTRALEFYFGKWRPSI